MKKNQKKLGNKGFSLVELIVVIAIMAVLVGVLAPTLIGNIEKSREAKDFTALDSVYSAVQTAYGDDAGNTAAQKITNITTGVTLDSIMTASSDAFVDQVKEYLDGAVPTLASKQAKSGKIYVSINGAKVKVWIAADSAKETPVEADKTKDADGKKKKFEVPASTTPASTTAPTT